jgi:hypothetical protein
MLRTLAIFAAMMALVTFTYAQSPRPGAIAGRVTDQGQGVGSTTVQAKEQATEKFFTATTAPTGQFRLAGLPAGTYEISVPQLGLRTSRYVQQGVVVEAAKTLTLNIALMPNNFGIVGDDQAFVQMLNKYAGIKGPAPRMPDGKPDFSGIWLANVDPNPEPASMLPWAVAELNRRREANFAGMPTASCLPTDPTLTLPVFYKIIQTRSLLVHLFEQDPHYRQVFLDGRGHPNDPDPTWMGHSIGKWDKDTLVIDTTGLNDKSWLLQGTWLPHSEMLHIVERYHRPDLAHLNIDVTLEDPGAFVKPVERHVTWQLAPGEELLESVCNENNKFQENAGLK